MGTTTPNIGLYIPADGETNYGTAFANGMLNLDTHDHSGAPTKGVPLSASGLANGSVTAAKLNSNVLVSGGGLEFGAGNAIQVAGILKPIFDLGSNGFIVRTSSSTVAPRTITGTTDVIDVNDGNGVADNPTINLSSNFFDTGTFVPTINTSNNDIGTVGYSIQDGNWQKIGKWIMIDLEIVFTVTVSTGSGVLVIEGLPEAAVGTYWFAGYINGGNLTPNQQVTSYQTSGTTILIFPVGTANSQLPVPGAVPYGMNMQLTGIYQWTA